jgi:exosome complex component RRP4
MRVVVPGELLYETPQQMGGAFVDNGRTYAAMLGMFDETERRLIPLEGGYIPTLGEHVIGVIEEVRFAGFNMDIKSPYRGFLPNSECRGVELKLGDVVFAAVGGVDEVRNVDLAEPQKLAGGKLVEILPTKVPRVIGKKGSMLGMIKDMTKCEVIVGKNGRIWLSGERTDAATLSILKIEKEAHTSGLTDRIKEFLESELKG